MAKPRNAKGMHGGGDKKTRGRTAITNVARRVSEKNPVPQIMEREATRPISAGAGKHRGDRRDTSRTYTTTIKHKTRGNNPRPDVKTRKR